MIVDFHTHFLADTRQISEHIAAAEFTDKSVVLAGPAPAGDDINDKLAQYVAGHKERMLGFAYIDPIGEQYSLKKLRSLIEKSGLCGAVLYCAQSGFHPAHSKVMRFYEAAEELGLPVFFHNGPVLGPDSHLEYAQPILIDGIAKQFKNLKIIIGDIGEPFIEQTFAVLEKNENVYADFTINPDKTWQTYNAVIAAFENKLFNKLLFGSGFPLARAERCIEVLLGFNKLMTEANLPTVPRAMIRDFLERDTLSILGIKQSTEK